MNIRNRVILLLTVCAFAVMCGAAAENGMVRFRDPEGRWLTAAADGITLSAEPEREELTWWTLDPAYGGWNIVNAEMKDRALAANSGMAATSRRGEEAAFVFNFYEPVCENP